MLRTLADVYVEAKWIAREIKRVMGLTGGMIKERDIAVLVRTTSMTRTLESALASARLRYRMVITSIKRAYSRSVEENSLIEKKFGIYLRISK